MTANPSHDQGRADQSAFENENLSEVRIGPPQTIPITDSQHHQAIRALATMIELWWLVSRNHEGDEVASPGMAEPMRMSEQDQT